MKVSPMAQKSREEILEYILKESDSHDVVLWSKSYCGECKRTRRKIMSIAHDLELKRNPQENREQPRREEDDGDDRDDEIRRQQKEWELERKRVEEKSSRQQVAPRSPVATIMKAARSARRGKTLSVRSAIASPMKMPSSSSPSSGSPSSPTRSLSRTPTRTLLTNSPTKMRARTPSSAATVTPEATNLDIVVRELDLELYGYWIEKELQEITGKRDVIPTVFIHGEYVALPQQPLPTTPKWARSKAMAETKARRRGKKRSGEGQGQHSPNNSRENIKKQTAEEVIAKALASQPFGRHLLLLLDEADYHTPPSAPSPSWVAPEALTPPPPPPFSGASPALEIPAKHNHNNKSATTTTTASPHDSVSTFTASFPGHRQIRNDEDEDDDSTVVSLVSSSSSSSYH